MSRKQLIGRVLDDECKLLMFHPAHRHSEQTGGVSFSILRKTEEEEHGEGTGNCHRTNGNRHVTPQRRH